MDLDLPCVPVGWQVAFFGRSGRRGRCFGLEKGRPGDPSGYASLGGPVGGHSIELVESGRITKFVRYLVTPGLFLSP